ncbi:shikimate dehydrogenase [Corynebacterium sp. HMSC034H07]|uniref:shikimate dehydrogenase n=1 Tax=Corynebacterium sp. HMSC034H07 TaxID=1739512 RepID=UPI0008A54AAB|nr:shikimate dehydrogenase [Corynebacterium sp. HMSC034H07]OFO98502.1 shikimate dehydrogenase [Corynebacterium sp. HMSC034H07]
MPRAAVLGSPIEHSLSPVLHKAGYDALNLQDWDYTRFEVTDLAAFLAEVGEEYRGFSVTMPLKFDALACADIVSERAELIGSANTLVRTAEGWRADNTDTEGVLGALEELLGSSQPATALLIGAGGTARPVLWGLAQRGVTDVTVLNRSDRLAELRPLGDALGLSLHSASFGEDLAGLARSVDLIVSTVPSAAVEEHLTQLAKAPVFDVIYDPWPTPLTVYAAADGYPTVGGHIMLANQAYSQFEQFTGHTAPRAEMLAALNAALKLP